MKVMLRGKPVGKFAPAEKDTECFFTKSFSGMNRSYA
jgi:hypothetical protein